MTEAEWLRYVEPARLLEHLRKHHRIYQGKANRRKLRLLACAGVRRVWNHVPDGPLRRGIEVSERFADGLATQQELDDAAQAGRVLTRRSLAGSAASLATGGAFPLRQPLVKVTYMTLNITRGCFFDPRTGSDLQPMEKSAQCHLIRDIFGHLLHQNKAAPAWLTWNDGVVVRLAQAAYDHRQLPEGTLDNGRLAILADALEEAGCTDADILDHLRGPGPHVQGCWPVDLVLGKS